MSSDHRKKNTPCIGVNYTGRLGNQLFIYAFTRYLIEMRHQETKVYANFEGSKSGREEDGFTDSLRHFQIFPYQVESHNLVKHHGSLVQKMVYALYAICVKIPFIADKRERFIALNRMTAWSGLYFSGPEDKARPPRSLPTESIFVSGFFQDKKNFDTIRSILLKELTPKYPPLEHNRQLYEVITSKNSVCVSIRRGDYLSPENKSNFYVCTPDYFHQAIQIIKEKVENAVFIFFSNDINWVRQHFHIDDCPCYYERGDDPVWETLRLMYSCHHFIISNSTFAWWAQYLCRRQDKMVICPSRWYANPLWTSNLIDNSFFTIDCPPE